MNNSLYYDDEKIHISTNSAKNFSMQKHHFHSFYEFYYLHEGTRKHFIDDKNYIFNAGTFAIIAPNILHQTLDTGIKHTRFLFHLTSKTLADYNVRQCLEEIVSNHKVIHLPIKMRIELENLFNELGDELTNKERNYGEIIECKIMVFIIYLLRYLKNNTTIENETKHSNDKVYEIIHYIKQNYSEQISLSSIAETFYMNKNYLSRLFKKTSGFTVMDFINMTRIIEAKKLISCTKKSIMEIAQEVGFCNQSNFGKTFKAITGLSPSEYRKQSYIT